MTTTEHITVLFTDLVGSTELQSSLAPDTADDVRNAHFSALRQAIASSGGTEVKNLGDGLMVVFPAASSGLGCAVAMQQAVHRDNVGAERHLGLRVGLSSGEASKEDGDYFGDPVIEAARLCARAGSGQILVSEMAKVNAGRRNTHAFTSLGELELKGLPDPVEALELAWVPLDDDVLAPRRVPLPARLSHRPTVGIIGREAELATMQAVAKRVTSGEGREVLFVAGEPGQGKTTLVGEFARSAHEAQITVLLGRCDEDGAIPYQAFHEALSHLVAHADEAVLRSHVAAHGGELDRIVPALRQRLGDLPPPQSTDPDAERYLLYGAVAGLLEAASADTPIVLVLDDLHWADKPTLQLLRHVVSRTATHRLLIVGTYRNAELSSAHPLEETLAALHREPPGVTVIEIKGLDDTGVIAFMEAAAGHQLDDAGVGLAHQLSRETDGNPFFVGEVLRHLSETGAIYQDTTGRWVAAAEERLALPHSIRSVIGTRVARLGEGAGKVLAMASVIGREFDVNLLAESTGEDEDTLLDLLEEAQRAALVSELMEVTDRYSFTHALVQHTLYEDLGPSRRTRAHRQVGEAMERLHLDDPDEHAGELARHFFLATRPADPTKAITYATRAGDAALRALSPDDAIRYYSQAFDLVAQFPEAEPTLRVDLLIGIGTAQRQVGRPEFRTTLLEAARGARELGDSNRLVAAALANSRGYFSSLGNVDGDKVDALQAALALLPDADSCERALLLATLCSELQFVGGLEQRSALANDAKAMARRLGDAATLCKVFELCNWSTESRWSHAAQLAESIEWVAAAESIDDPLIRFSAAGEAAVHAFRAGQFDLADERHQTSSRLSERLQQPQLVWGSTFRSAARAISLGDIERAEELATSALELGVSSGQPDAFGIYSIQVMIMRYVQGRMGEVAPLIADVAEQNPTMPAYEAALAASFLEGGDAAGAQDLIDRAAAASFPFPEDVGWFDCMLNYARVSIELGLTDHAETFFERLAPFHDQVPHNGFIPYEPIATYLGGLATVCGRYDEAEMYFVEAEELNVRGGMRFAEAQTKTLWGRMLRHRGGAGDIQRARAVLLEAQEVARRGSYAGVERRASVELSALS